MLGIICQFVTSVNILEFMYYQTALKGLKLSRPEFKFSKCGSDVLEEVFDLNFFGCYLNSISDRSILWRHSEHVAIMC